MMISRFDRLGTDVPGNGLRCFHFAPAVPLKAWVLSPVKLFADLRRLPLTVPLSQVFTRIARSLTGDADTLGCGKRSTLSSRPSAGLDTRFRF